MNKTILYLGDTRLTEAAAYLAGIMTYYRISYDYYANEENFDTAWLDRSYRAIIISDYPAGNFTREQLERVAAEVNSGTGLLMIGGWESFAGEKVEYTHTPLRDVLPVIMQDHDDRMNCSSPCLIEKNAEHVILADLPFDANVTGVGGFNRFAAKENCNTLLSIRRFQVKRDNGQFVFEDNEVIPLLVTGEFGLGRAAAFAGDVAPHWVGGLVDWGDERVKAQADGSIAIEVGNWYAQFFANLVKWVAELDSN